MGTMYQKFIYHMATVSPYCNRVVLMMLSPKYLVINSDTVYNGLMSGYSSFSRVKLKSAPPPKKIYTAIDFLGGRTRGMFTVYF